MVATTLHEMVRARMISASSGQVARRASGFRAHQRGCCPRHEFSTRFVNITVILAFGGHKCPPLPTACAIREDTAEVFAQIGPSSRENMGFVVTHISGNEAKMLVTERWHRKFIRGRGKRTIAEVIGLDAAVVTKQKMCGIMCSFVFMKHLSKDK